MAGFAWREGAQYAFIIPLFLATCQHLLPTVESNLFPYDGHKKWVVDGVKSSEEITLPDGVSIPFYGMKYTKAWISLHGAISFDNHLPMVLGSIKLPLEDEDIPLAAVYYTNADMSKKSGDGPELQSTISHHLYDSAVEADWEMLNVLRGEILMNAVGDWGRFMPKHAIMTTWSNIRNGGCNKDGIDCPRNTYQAVLVTDGQFTFAIYNYHNLTWYGGLYDDCDRNTGTGEDCFPAQVGFNAGGSREFTPLPFSNSKNVVTLDEHAGSRVVGRHIWRVSHDHIIREGCSTAEKTLTIDPPSAGMLGGEEVFVAGPCLQTHDVTSTVMCQLSDGAQFKGRIVDRGRIGCVLPPIDETGDRVDIVVKLSDDDEFRYRGNIQITRPQRIRTQVKLHEFHTQWIQRNPAELTLSWEPRHLHGIWFYNGDTNLTTEPPEMTVDSVDILLIGYREVDGDDLKKGEWKLLHSLHTGHPNSGQFTFKPKDHRCVLDDCLWHLGIIKIVPSNSKTEPYLTRGLLSRMTALGWYIDQVMEGQHGKDWPDEMCKTWKEDDENWQKDLVPCPCTCAQAHTDRGRYMVGAECEESDPPVACPFRPEATDCFVSRVPTPYKAQTECCYNDEGTLIYSGDNVNGSFSGRAHENGVRPYKHDGAVPLLSHWLTDKLPHLWCCVWSSTRDLCRAHYQPYRPTPDCRLYQPHKIAVAFGDPHFRTFDGTEYTFNGLAEYWLLHVTTLPQQENFQLQARMENALGNADNLNATVITAVAMQEGNSPGIDVPKIMVIRRPPLALDRLAVYVNDKYQSFYDIAQRSFLSSDNKRETVIERNSDGVWQSNFTVTFQSGVSVTVAESNGLLHVTTAVPPSYFEKTNGLFGNWDGNPANDLKTRDGKIIVLPENTKDIHEKFGVSWAVRRDESIFTYFGKEDWIYFQKIGFVPNYEAKFPDGPHGITEEKVRLTCGDNYICTFDFKTTLNEKVATSSVQAAEWAQQMDNMSAAVVACPYLSVPRSYRTTTGYLAGTGTVSLTGCQSGYTVVGEADYECVEVEGAGNWVPAPNAVCKDNNEIADEQSRLAAAIAVPITLVLLITVVAIAAFMIFRRRKSSKPPAPTKFDDLPRQQPPVNPNPQPTLSSYPNPGLTGSRTSVSSRASRTSENSIVLTEELKPARPMRPAPTLVRYPQIPPTDQLPAQPRPPSTGYVNTTLDSDVPADTGHTGLDRRQVGYDNLATEGDGQGGEGERAPTPTKPTAQMPDTIV